MMQENLVAFLHVLTCLVTLGVSVLMGPDLPIPKDAAKFLGGLMLLIGLAVFTWAVVYLRGAFFGSVEPRAEQLVVQGPYRWLRHPLYLGMVISILGLVLGLRSLWGVIGVFLLFMPAGMYRAWLEEKALARTFGREWDDYVGRTYFILPPLW